MKNIQNIILLSFLLLFPGCKEKSYISDEQEILFQMDYVNYAWGYQHYGYMVDNQGRILTYDNPEKWNFPDDNFILTEKQMAENIALCRVSDEMVSSEDLKRFSSYIENIAASKVSALRQTGADAGSLQFICYKYSENSLMYKGFMMKTEGDFTAENLNFYSKKIVSWMKEIEVSLSSK